MKVLLCSYDEISVSMTLEEFRGITGHSVGDQWGNSGTAHREMHGKIFNLKPMIEAVYSVRVAAEVKRKVKEMLGDISKNIDSAFFPITETMPKIVDTEIKPKKAAS